MCIKRYFDHLLASFKSVSYGQCDARSKVTFAAMIEHHCHATDTNLYCLVTEAHVHVNNLPKVTSDSGMAERQTLQARCLEHYNARLHEGIGHVQNLFKLFFRSVEN